MDPVVHHSLSPYNAFDNNPVFWADPSGADAIMTDSAITYTGADAGAFFNAFIGAMDGESTTFTIGGTFYDLTLEGNFDGSNDITEGDDDSKKQQQDKSFESGVRNVLNKSKIGQEIDSEDLVKLYGIPKDAASLINSFKKTSSNTIKIDWVSGMNPKMALVKTVSDAKFNDGTIKITYVNGTMKISGDAIGIKYNGKVYNDLTIKGDYATMPNVTNKYKWKIGN